jgi:hypothetical protein
MQDWKEDVVLDWVSRSPDIPKEVKQQLEKMCRQKQIKGSVLEVLNDKMLSENFLIVRPPPPPSHTHTRPPPPSRSFGVLAVLHITATRTNTPFISTQSLH